ncbi:Fpg/Nei family DNA glycosylase [bacterium]|nr:MAG: Fpg/Nei family DNA glycosylase [bacterium]
MPELPEVEAARCMIRRTLQGSPIREVSLPDDPILLGDTPPEAVRAALLGSTVMEVGRKGKYWWLELDRSPWVFGHLGMTGQILDFSDEPAKYRHGRKALDENGEPKWLKLDLRTEDGRRLVFSDPRRLGRLWLAENAASDRRLAKLGPDAFEDLPSPEEFHRRLARRKAPLKAVLLDQAFLAGIGNYLADEMLYQARVAPDRIAASLSVEETARLRTALQSILSHAVSVDADYERFPTDWLFHHRWGGDKGSPEIGGRAIQRDTIGGRTTAWVPELQR